MRRLRTILLLFVTVGAASECSLFDPNGNACLDAIDWDVPPSINVAIRDQAGRPTALGAVVVFGGEGGLARDSTRGDSLTIRGGGYNTAYGVLVSKPYYTAVTFNNVSVPGTFDGCGKPKKLSPPVTLEATLVILPDAPPVRSLYVMSATGSTFLDRGGRDSLTIEPWLDANTTVSHAIIWRLTGDTASVSFNPATGVASFRCRPTLGIVNIVALSAADTNVTASMTLRVQEHPASSGDPPCS